MRQPLLEEGERTLVVPQSTRARAGPFGAIAMARHGLPAQLTKLGELVCREQGERFVTRAGYLSTQRGLTLAIATDAVVIADREYEAGDLSAKASFEVGSADVRLFDDIVKHAGGYQVIRRSGATQQRCHLDRMQNEGSSVGSLLPAVPGLCKGYGGLGEWKVVYKSWNPTWFTHGVRGYGSAPAAA